MPRPTETNNYTGSILGAVVGAFFGGRAGAMLGGAIGTFANPNTKMSLERAISELLRAQGLQFENLTRVAKNTVQVMFTRPDGGYWFFVATSPFDIHWTSEQLDDALYDASKSAFDNWVQSHGG